MQKQKRRAKRARIIDVGGKVPASSDTTRNALVASVVAKPSSFQGAVREWLRGRPQNLKAYLITSSIENEKGCWVWQRSKNRPSMTVKGKTHFASKISYLCFNGKVPNGLIVRHTCDDAFCVNPEHLMLGTQKDNRQDFINRHPRAREIMLINVAKASAGWKKFWTNADKKTKDRVNGRRSKTLRTLYPSGTPSRIRQAESIAQWHAKQSEAEKQSTSAKKSLAIKAALKLRWNKLSKAERTKICAARSRQATLQNKSLSKEQRLAINKKISASRIAYLARQ